MRCIEASLTILWLIGAVKNPLAMRPIYSRHAAGYLNYQHFKALTSLDFGIAASKRGQRKSYGWALCSNEIQNLIRLKNLSKLVSVIFLYSYFKEDMDDQACMDPFGACSCVSLKSYVTWTAHSMHNKFVNLAHYQSYSAYRSSYYAFFCNHFPANLRLMNSLIFVFFTDLSKCCWMISMTLQCCGRQGKLNPSSLVRDFSLFGSVGSGTAIAWLIGIEDFGYERT